MKIVNIPIINKIYIWSILSDPLLFFIFTSHNTWAAVPLTLSRVLQLLFLTLFLIKIIANNTSFTFLNPLNSKNRYITAYIFLIVCSSLLGIYFGSYYDANPDLRSDYSGVFGGKYIRPFFEIFLLIYYFIYFVILPRYFIQTKIQLKYLLKLGLILLWVVIFLGLSDVIFTFLGMDIIPRHLVDTRWVEVGGRFHSILGEPRDANVYIFFSIAFLYINSALNNSNIPSKATILLLFCCAMLTQSFSGLIGLLSALGLLVIFSELSLKKLLLILYSLIVIGLIFYLLYSYSPRIYAFFEVFSSLQTTVIPGYKKLPNLIYVQSADIIPILLIYERLISMDFYNLFFGSGIGTASFFTNNFTFEFLEVNNPRAQVSRIVFESGLAGFYIYLMILIKPIKEFLHRIDSNYRTYFFISSIFLIGAVMGQRSNLSLIFIGILYTVLINNLFNLKEKY